MEAMEHRRGRGKREAERALAKKQELEAAKKKSAENRKLIFSQAKQFSKEYEQKENEVIQLKREAKLKGGIYVEPEAKLLFIVRIHGSNAMDPKTRKILQLLRLRQIFNGIFLKVNKATVNMLKAPLGGLKKKRKHSVEEGDAGNHENYINELIWRMN
ncbi:hypothetical protein Q3G72_022064 [Acer saccharum]|nr:hypothetical protein Q3G72_022064 [Acer saccharum]